MHARDRARVAVAVGGRDLGAPPRAAVARARGVSGGLPSTCASSESGSTAAAGPAARDSAARRHQLGDARVLARPGGRCGSRRRAGRATSSRKKRAERAPVDAPDDLADQVAVGQRVVAAGACPAPTTAPRAASAAVMRVPVVERLDRRAARGAPRGRRVWLEQRSGPGSPPCRPARTPASSARPARRGRAGRGRRACARTSAVIAFVVENTLTIVSRSHGRVRAASAWPPQRSTTGSPSTVAANDAPTSRPAAKFAANASRTAAKRGAHSPCTIWHQSSRSPSSVSVSSFVSSRSSPWSAVRSALELGHAPAAPLHAKVRLRLLEEALVALLEAHRVPAASPAPAISVGEGRGRAEGEAGQHAQTTHAIGNKKKPPNSFTVAGRSRLRSEPAAKPTSRYGIQLKKVPSAASGSQKSRSVSAEPTA